ncbi:NAD(P)/FAD-dependent oxidoreductase [Limnospira platensis CENA597]|uniref:NAD(P)/FAD-dependent oxidoreductase n=1 Tax=Limnospira platensis TaxID=118562 RepID=UPI003D6F1E9E
MTRVVIVGCGIIGAAIAYELSLVSGLTVTVVDRHPPATQSTAAALGVLMGVISHKTKGRAWALRRESMARYETLIPELEACNGYAIPFNREGILMLGFEGENWHRWQELATIRREQGFHLELMDQPTVRSHYPQINCERVTGAIYSPSDRQVNPTTITKALVAAAQKNGAKFNFGVNVEGWEITQLGHGQKLCQRLNTASGSLPADWVVVAAGLGSTPLLQSQSLPSGVTIKPVLGQALKLRCGEPLGGNHPQPVITGDDVHIVPLGGAEYWVGATVEFPDPSGEVQGQPQQLDSILQGAIAICPALAQGEIIHQWHGLRPRPEGRPAPVIGPLAGFANVLLATGHYRNGVLLAPATALEIRQMISGSI